MSDKFKKIDDFITAVTEWGDSPVNGCRMAMEKFKDDESRWYCFGKLLLWSSAICLEGVTSKHLVLYILPNNSVVITNTTDGVNKNSYKTFDIDGNVVDSGSYDGVLHKGCTPCGHIMFSSPQLNTVILTRNNKLLSSNVLFSMSKIIMNQFEDYYNSMDTREKLRQYLDDNFFMLRQNIDKCLNAIIMSKYSPLAILISFDFKPKHYMPEYVMFQSLQKIPLNSFFLVNNFIGHTGYSLVNFSYFLILNGVTIDNYKVTVIMSASYDYVSQDVGWNKVVNNMEPYNRKTDYYQLLVDKNIGYKYPSC